jgi:hypothetical protein
LLCVAALVRAFGTREADLFAVLALCLGMALLLGACLRDARRYLFVMRLRNRKDRVFRVLLREREHAGLVPMFSVGSGTLCDGVLVIRDATGPDVPFRGGKQAVPAAVLPMDLGEAARLMRTRMLRSAVLVAAQGVALAAVVWSVR